jgi:catechol 2,3-dioxygenase-like lactoylglutathione lyase family enzyme
MNIQRIIPELRSTDLPATRAFYYDLFGLNLDMHDGAFMMFSSATTPSAQLTVNDNGHAGLPPGFAIDVGNAHQVSALHEMMRERGFVIVEPLADKPWGIRRFSVLDPNGARVTLIGHTE